MILYRRPLRFLVIVLGAWSVARVAVLWPTIEDVPDVVRAIAAVPSADAFARRAPLAVQAVPSRVLVSRDVAPSIEVARAHERATQHAASFSVPHQIAAAGSAVPIPQRATDRTIPTQAIAPSPAPTAASRFAVSGWLIARPGGAATAFAPQLGGSQAGLRLTYALCDSRRVALAARISTPLGRGQREAAVGVDWRPFDAPVHLFAEQRFALGAGRGGPAAGVIAGLDPTRVAGPLLLEGYGQAGVIGRRSGEGFADGALRLGAPVARLGKAALNLGVGVWGAAQRGARRVDVGPSAALIAPVGGKPVRVSLEWRERVAGNARPASGPALSLGSDF